MNSKVKVVSGPDFSHLSFLVVDALPFIRHLVQGMLERMQAARILQASSGEEALERLRDGPDPMDCVISDWSMGPLGGLQLLQAIRSGAAGPTPPATPFIMLTGYGDEPVVRAARALDVSGYLIKPVSFGKLAKAVDTAVTRTVAPRPAESYREVVEIHVPEKAAKAPAGGRRAATLRPAEKTPARPAEPPAPAGLEVRLSDLAQMGPGTMLAQDVHSADGMLLLARGQLLDAGIVGLLKRVVDAEGNNDVKVRVTLAAR